MSGISGDWLGWMITIGLVMTALCFLISLLTRRFLSGVALVLVTVSLTLFLILLWAGSGMAKNDFTLGFVMPFAFIALAVAVAWLLFMKARAGNK